MTKKTNELTVNHLPLVSQALQIILQQLLREDISDSTMKELLFIEEMISDVLYVRSLKYDKKD